MLFKSTVGVDRKADEERQLVRIVIHQIDPHRQPLHDFHEIARRILRRQQRQRRAGAHREAGDAALELLLAAVHVHLQIHALADAQIAKLRFLEIRIDPDVAQRADRHQALADLHVVAGIHVAARDDAVDLRDDRAVAQIELRLIEIALRLQQFRLGLLQRRRSLDDVGVDLVDVAAGIALVEFLDHLLRREIVGRRDDAELRRALHQFAQRLAHGGKGLVEIRPAHP